MDQDSPTQPTPIQTPPPIQASGPVWTPEPARPAASVPVVPVTGRKGPSARVLNLLLGGALVLAVAGISFAVGRMTAPAPAAATRGTFPNGQAFDGYFGNRGNGGGFSGGGFVGAGGGGVSIEGTVESVSATTLTLKLASGQTVQVALDPTTTYHSQADASATDIVTGGKVLVRINLRGVDGGATASGPSARDITVEP